jgi:hypothetical protein
MAEEIVIHAFSMDIYKGREKALTMAAYNSMVQLTDKL